MNHREQHPDLYRRGPYLNKYAADPTQNKTKSKSQSADPALARALKAARQSAELTQNELAKILSVSRSQVAQWESAARAVPFDIIDNIKKVLPGAAKWKVERAWWSSHQAKLRDKA